MPDLLVEVDNRLAVGVGAELALVVDLCAQLLVVVDLPVDGERQLAVLVRVRVRVRVGVRVRLMDLMSEYLTL